LKLKILKKLRTASLNSEFTGSYKKVYCGFLRLKVVTKMIKLWYIQTIRSNRRYVYYTDKINSIKQSRELVKRPDMHKD